ncbi:MAG: TIM barrel protein [Planctomycetes bacterium]|nr:TIM barrel protein [Planctomycetota bacterium]
MTHPTRRQLFGSTLSAAALSACSMPQRVQAEQPASDLKLCLNTATIRGQKLPLDQQIDVTIKAGYDGIEPWVGDMEAYKKAGGSLGDLAKKCADHNLKVISAIGFAPWIIDDDAKRAAGLEQAKRDMALVKELGGTHLAAPPAGATREPVIDLYVAAERYRALLDIGHDIGVIPEVEVWGFSRNLGKLSEATFVAIEAGHPDACVLPDIFHLYKGGTDASSLSLLGRMAIRSFHFNDYPAMDRAQVTDADRVYPGDGTAPIGQIINILRENRCNCYLSLELFNKALWQQDALTVAKTGLEKLRAVARL